jgi:hypothetical protein
VMLFFCSAWYAYLGYQPEMSTKFKLNRTWHG